VRALVLVGGQGTRLRPLTYDAPKQMLPIVGRPMIARVLEWLGGYGVDEVVLSLGYRPDAFLAAYPDGHIAGVAIRYAVEDSPLDTAGAIAFAAREAGFEDDRLIVLNGDVLTDLDLGRFVEFHERSGAAATIALTPVEDPSAFGVVPTAPDGHVLAFIEKPEPGTAPTNLINAGIYILEPPTLAAIPRDRPVSIEREIFPLLVADGGLYAASSDAYWIDSGTPATYLGAQLDIVRGRRRGVALDVDEVAPGLRVATGVRAGAEIHAPAYVGAGSVVAPGAEVADAVIGEACRIEAGASVRSAVLLDRAVVRRGAVVESSVIGWGAVVGEGATLTGGTLVGAGTEVEPGALLDGARRPV